MQSTQATQPDYWHPIDASNFADAIRPRPRATTEARIQRTTRPIVLRTKYHAPEYVAPGTSLVVLHVGDKYATCARLGSDARTGRTFLVAREELI